MSRGAVKGSATNSFLQRYVHNDPSPTPRRQYRSRYGVIYLLNNSLRALGLIWSKDSAFVQSVCVWHKIDFDAAPDAIVDIPQEATLDQVFDSLVKFIKQPRVGVIEGVEEKPRRFDPNADEKAQDHPEAQQQPQAQEEPHEIVLVGRKPDGTLFEIPNMKEMNKKFQSWVSAQNIDPTSDEAGMTMEEQYEALEKKIELVAGGKSTFLKSLLITGAPSAGKTFRVMKKIKELGLQEGTDYIVKKGKISPHSLYRVLIEQSFGGMAIFDDCDSVVKSSEDAVNMLKGALDTDAVREVSYDVKGLLNTGAMPKEKRDAVQRAMSKILRGVATLDDIRVLDQFRGVKTRQGTAVIDDEDHPDFVPSWHETDDGDEPMGNDPTPDELQQAEAWVMKRLPNKIDFQGRVIFISNMSVAEWSVIGDGAIMTRAFHQNMNFESGEMLDFIDKIKSNIRTPSLSDQDKQDVIDYLRELFMAGKIKKPINFRLAQQAFDLFLMNDWKSLVAQAVS